MRVRACRSAIFSSAAARLARRWLTGPGRSGLADSARADQNAEKAVIRL
jgi:hypothetical protein